MVKIEKKTKKDKFSRSALLGVSLSGSAACDPYALISAG